MRKPAIPRVPPSLDQETTKMLDALKQNVETFTGLRGGRVARLTDDSTTADIKAAVNAILDRLQ